MILAGVGLSGNSITKSAAREASERAAEGFGGARADFSIVFATAEHGADLGDLVDVVAESSGSPYVVGCSAAGVLAADREIEEGAAIGVLSIRSDAVRATPFLFRDEGDNGLTAGLHVGQRLLASRDTNDVVLAWPDPFTVRPDRLLQGVDAVLGPVPVAGGAASSSLPSGGTFQFNGGDAGRACVSGLRLGGAFRHQVALTQGCRPLGPPMTVTRAHENLILEVDGIPALTALRAAAPEHLFDDPDQALAALTVAFLPEPEGSRVQGGEYLVRNIVAADPDTGVIAVAAEVEEGQSILFAQREAKAAREDVERMASRAARAAPPGGYAFGLYFDCLARGRSLYGCAGVDSHALARHLPGLPWLGFFCSAEIAPLRGANHLFTYTGVLVLFSE
ncbi:MAG TPA: FIST N-terminal domain-containing protein [Candidatus Polarisedimenticolaceae bacterium]|nr:FIST N-terminal domain-containing protein [Candidatus Polarisedimenticolaceae bacterium]